MSGAGGPSLRSKRGGPGPAFALSCDFRPSPSRPRTLKLRWRPLRPLKGAKSGQNCHHLQTIWYLEFERIQAAPARLGQQSGQAVGRAQPIIACDDLN